MEIVILSREHNKYYNSLFGGMDVLMYQFMVCCIEDTTIQHFILTRSNEATSEVIILAKKKIQ